MVNIPPLQAASDIENDVAHSGAAIFSNRFFISLGPGGVRISFAEQYAPDKAPIFRTAVVLPVTDGISLSKVLQSALKEAESAIDTAIAEEKIKTDQAAKKNG